MCSGDVDSDGEKPTLRSLKELKADFERRRPRPVLRPLKELSLDYARQKRCAAQPQALRSLAELAADFQARAPAPAPAPAGESAACQELSGRPTYGRDELLAVLASMPLGPSGGDGGRGAGIQTIKFEAPPGLEPLGLGPAPVEQQEDPSLDDEALLARLEAREAREAGADRHNAETFGPHAEVEEVGLAEEDEADEAYLASLGLSYLIDDDEADSLCGARGDEESDKARRIKAEFLAQMDGAAWDLQPHQADGEAFEAQEFWWNMAAMDQQCYAEDMWDFSEGFLGYEHSSYWGYPQNMEGFQDGLLSGDMYFGLAPPVRERPRALFVVAPSGGGKTTVLRTNAWRFDMKVEEAVFADSAAFRDRHGQYRALVENGKRNDGIWFNAWPAVKGVAVSSKKKIVQMATQAKKDLLMSDTGTEPDKLVKNMHGLIEQGYTVHFCGVFAAPREIIARGVAREVGEGKRYNRSEKKLCQTFDAFAPAARAANGKFCIVRNSSGRSPEVYMEGRGGAEISFSLEQGLAWAGPEPAAEAT